MKKNKLILASLLAIAGFMSMGLAACGGDTPVTESSSALAPFVDYSKKSEAKLTLDYKGKTFAKDGIEQVTLRTCIDGDTAHFNPTTPNEMIGKEDYIKARFFGIDTPESTGKVEPYGRGASDYTKEKLKAAEKNGTIVVSSPSLSYTTPTPDSTGSRYVSLIWINTEKKNAPIEELQLLNLLIVQDGWSFVKNVAAMPSLSDTFYAAETQAKAYKLHLFSGEDDPQFNYGAYEDVSLLELKHEVQASMKDSSHKNKYDNQNVRVSGTVAGYSNHILYLQDFFPTYDKDGNIQYDKDGKPIGEYAGINIFCGMSAIGAKYTTVNTYLSVCGNAADSENFGFQISGATFPNGVSYNDTDAKVIIKAADNVEEHALYTFEYTPKELDAVTRNSDYSYESLNCAVKLTEDLTVTGGYTSTDGSEMTLYVGNDLNFTIFLTMPVRPDPNNTALYWRKHTDFVGHTIRVTGVFGVHKNSSGKYKFQILPSAASDVVVTDYVAS